MNVDGDSELARTRRPPCPSPRVVGAASARNIARRDRPEELRVVADAVGDEQVPRDRDPQRDPQSIGIATLCIGPS
jgi:hypothetical protein